jgi:hypothetical protein
MDEFEVLDSGELRQTHATSFISMPDAQTPPPLESVIIPLPENTAMISEQYSR